jgi:hypothetical protein
VTVRRKTVLGYASFGLLLALWGLLIAWVMNGFVL